MNINTRDMNFVKFNNQDMEWVKFNGVIVWEGWKTLTVQGVPPISLQKCANKNLVGYQIYGNSKQGELPDGYTQLEYIQSTGTQYIDTGLKATNKTKTEIIYEPTSNGWFYGYKTQTQGSGHASSLTTSGGGTFDYFGDRKTASGFTTGKATFLFDANEFYVDGVLVATHPTVADQQTAGNVYLMNVNVTGSTVTQGQGKLYSAKIYDDNGILVRNFIPCINNQNVIGLYDLVNDTFYSNEGTGVFTAGPEMPNPDNPIEIQSVGDKTNNLFDNNQTFSQGQYANGVWENIMTRVTTDYIETKTGQTLTIFTDLNDENKVALINYNLFDENKNWLGNRDTNGEEAFSGVKQHTFTINLQNVKYIKITFRSSINATTNLSISSVQTSKTQLEEGSTATDYEPYGYKIPVNVTDTNNITTTTENIYLAEPLRKIGDADAVKLPSGYTQLEYIESTGTQYIDTGVILTQEHSVEIEAKLMARVSNKSYYLFGVSTSGKRYAITVGAKTNTYNFDFIDSTYRINSEINAFDNAFHVHKIENLNYYIDGILQGGNSLTGNTYNSSYLFDTREHTIVSTTGEQRWKVKRCSIWNGSLLVRNFIPAKRNSNGEIGMYDLVNDTFYTNQGTGDFTAGPQIYADYVDFENQKVVRNVRELVITGDEAWEFINNIARFTIANSQLSDTGIDYSAQLCNYFKCDQITTGGTTKGASVYYSSSLGGTYFRVRDDIFKSSTVAKQFFKDLYNSGKPCKIYYQSVAPTEESIELPDILLNKGTNVVDVETSLKPSNLWLKYKGKE